MLDGNRNHDDEKPGIEERYTVATSASNLKLDTRDGSPGRPVDVIIAAGWNESRIGGALLRLHTEYDGSEKPRMASREDFMPPGRQDRDQRKAAARRAHEFNLHELGLLLQKLKSLPAVREQLTIQMIKWRAAEAESKAIDILRWWLAQACPDCGGTKFKTAEGTGRHTGKVCETCLGTGKRELPHGQEGRRLANFMDQCVERARASIGRRLHS